MINIIEKKLPMEKDLKKRLETIYSFCNTTLTIIDGNIRKIDKTNLSYIEPNKIIINCIIFLAFNYSKTLYVGNLRNKLELSDLENFIKNYN